MAQLLRGSDCTVRLEAQAPTASPPAPALPLLQQLRAWAASACAMEEARLAFFYPSRLYVALALSLLGCAVCFLMLSYLCDHLGGIAQGALSVIRRTALSAVKRAQEARDIELDSVRAQVQGTVQAWLEGAAGGGGGGGGGLPSPQQLQQLLLGAVGGLPSGPTSDALSSGQALVVAGSALGSSALQQATAAAVDALASGSDAAILDLVDSYVSWLTPLALALTSVLRQALLTGASLALLCVLLCQWALLLRYREIALLLRRGGSRGMPLSFHWVRGHASAAAATTFIGQQLGGTVVSYTLFTLLFTLLFFVLLTPFLLGMVLEQAATVLVSLLGVALVLSLLRALVLSHITTSGATIVFRRCHSLADLWLTFFALFTGLMLAVTRWALLTVAFLVALQRPDLHIMPYATKADPLSRSFAGLLLLDLDFNAPVAAVARDAFMGSLEGLRQRGGAGGAGAQQAHLCCASTGSVHSAGAGAAGADKDSALVVQVNPLRQGAAGVAGREGQLPVPGAQEGGGALTPAPPPLPHPAQHRATAWLRARNRWQLAFLLLRNQSLKGARGGKARQAREPSESQNYL